MQLQPRQPSPGPSQLLQHRQVHSQARFSRALRQGCRARAFAGLRARAWRAAWAGAREGACLTPASLVTGAMETDENAAPLGARKAAGGRPAAKAPQLSEAQVLELTNNW